MLDSFIHTYKNDLGLSVLYFYPGYDELNRLIYKLDFEDTTLDYKFTKGPDKSIEYTFLNKDIKSLVCNLINLPKHTTEKIIINL